MTTHTHRGIGLGFTSQMYPDSTSSTKWTVIWIVSVILYARSVFYAIWSPYFIMFMICWEEWAQVFVEWMSGLKARNIVISFVCY
jgi:hypothetical protein